MPTFIDESGDPGIGEDCSPMFTLFAVYCENESDAQICREAIMNLRKIVLKQKDRFEFKSSRCKAAIQHAFFRNIRELPFHFATCTIIKELLPIDQRTKQSVVQLAVAGMTSILVTVYSSDIEKQKGEAVKERIHVDQHNDPCYLSILRNGFYSLKSRRGKRGGSLIKSIKTVRSESEDLIQLADMVGGAFNRWRMGDLDFFNSIAHKCIGQITIPEMEVGTD